MKSEISVTLSLNMDEAKALRKLVGGLNDTEFKKAGISGGDRETMRSIFAALWFAEDDE